MRERTITLQLRPRQAMLLNMMYTLAGASMNGESIQVVTLIPSCVNFAAFIRSLDPSEVQDLSNKISNIRHAFSFRELDESGIAVHATDPISGALVVKRSVRP